MAKRQQIPVHKPKTQSDFAQLNKELRQRGFVAIDALKPGKVREVLNTIDDPSKAGAEKMATAMHGGSWSTGPLRSVAWNFDDRDNTPTTVTDADGKPLGLGYVNWGAANNIPSTIPVLAQALPYTAAPLRYIADLTAGLGPKLMYRFEDGDMVEFRDAGTYLREEMERLESESEDMYPPVKLSDDGRVIEQQESRELKRARETYQEWERTWYGYDEKDPTNGEIINHVPGAKEFLEDNNLNLHLLSCEQDDVMLDIYFPTVCMQRGRAGNWDPKIIRCDMLPSHSVRLERRNEYNHINHVYYSDQWRTLGATSLTTATNPESKKVVMYPAAMPQHLLSDLRYIVESNRRSRIKDRPVWIVCPTYYPSGQKPYYPQPAWWSIFTSKAFDFSSTILYDKAKARENKTSWGKIFYISLDYLNEVFADNGIADDKKAQEEFMNELEQSMEDFLKRRENNGKMMRQWMWVGPDGKEHHNVEIVDVAETTKDAAAAGKDELELSTSPIFLALQVDPRLVGVPMAKASNGGTALREMHLLKQQQLNPKQRNYLHFLNTICRFNKWDEHAEFIIAQQTLTTLDNSKTGTVETVAGEEA